MFSFTIDLGQTILGIVIAIVGYLINRTLTSIFDRLDKHEDLINQLNLKVGFLTGKVDNQ